ncbi:MED17 [Cordylochernes scorpioides]|uniref:MED17 n=1 Tax=Cordylochernes scorpioides TaxID=51811 RepID=A0ABY6K7L7_9ARAC|nr:MED17 [Cordylochernes scorpioides]
MSENLTKLANKIDFSKLGSEGGESAGPSTPQEDAAESLPSFQPSLWPWDGVRNKLRAAHTEISVLVDDLYIIQNKKYMVLDAVSQEPPEPNLPAVLLAKKKMLSEVSSIIISGAERLRTTQSEAIRNRNINDFHIELLHMRQNWRLKRVGNTILGDLSYRSAGSQFWQSGVFEVSKLETPVPSPPTTQRSSLKVTLPTELEGIALIQVSIQKDMLLMEEFIGSSLYMFHYNEMISSGEMNMPQLSVNFSDAHWQPRLEAAQNVLFCKELFAQLAREAIQLQPSIPNLVVGHQITASLFPGVQLCIGLCHTTSSDKPVVKWIKCRDGVQTGPRGGENKPVLEHSLHQMLREVHHRATFHDMPHPTTAPLGLSRKRRLAGPEAHDKATLAQYTHRYVRALLCCCRTPLVIHVGEKCLKAVNRESTVINLSYEPHELRYFLMYQVAQHQINAAQALAKVMGWKVITTCNASSVGGVEPIASASSLVISSPTGDRWVALVHWRNYAQH